MKLNAKVIGIQAASGTHDGKRRVDIKPEGSYGSIIVPSDELQEDEELVVLVVTPAQEQALRVSLEHLERDAQLLAPLYPILRQLRPDAPPPFLRCGFMLCGTQCVLKEDHYGAHCFEPQPNTADTQEFRLGGTA